MWLHCLDVCRIKSYIISKEKKLVGNQKNFVLDWIVALNNRAQFIETQRTRKAVASLTSPVDPRKEKRFRISSTKPQLPSHRLLGEKKIM
jgi:hypothetical protein